MTKEEIIVLLERAESWPKKAQEELVRSALDIEKKHSRIYRLNDRERADIREGLKEIKRGDVASEAEVRATFDELRKA